MKSLTFCDIGYADEGTSYTQDKFCHEQKLNTETTPMTHVVRFTQVSCDKVRIINC